MKFTLKDYQRDAVLDTLTNLGKARRLWHSEHDKTAFSLTAVTGAGKTVMAAAAFEALFHCPAQAARVGGLCGDALQLLPAHRVRCRSRRQSTRAGLNPRRRAAGHSGRHQREGAVRRWVSVGLHGLMGAPRLGSVWTSP